jgi:hypothetical protein
MAHLNNNLLLSAAAPVINSQPSVANSVIIIDITGV